MPELPKYVPPTDEERAEFKRIAAAKDAQRARFGSPYNESRTVSNDTFEAPYDTDSYSISVRTYEDAPSDRFVFLHCDGDEYYTVGFAKREEMDSLINMLTKARDTAWPQEQG